MVAKKQHYVPQFYLRGFSETNNNQVNIYRKKNKQIIPTNVRSICYENYFYDLEDNTFLKKYLELRSNYFNLDVDVEKLLKENPQYIETFFLNRLESDSSNIINAILKSSNGIILQDRAVQIQLLIFFCNLHERSPYKRNKYKNLHTQKEEANDRFPNSIRNHLVQNSLFNPTELQIKNMISPYNNNTKDYLDFALKNEWTLGITDYNNQFISSDNPAGVFLMDEFCFPISTTKAILFRPKSPNQRKLYLDKTNKKYTTEFSDKSVFINNLLQNRESKMLIGNKESLEKFMSLVNN